MNKFYQFKVFFLFDILEEILPKLRKIKNQKHIEVIRIYIKND